MASSVYDVIVIGAGQAGLGLSYYLKQAGIKHIVLERGQFGESWLAQRWDSFQLNTPNVMNTLPGMPYDGDQPDGFWRSEELRAYFRRYIDYFNLPVRTGVSVTSLTQGLGTDGFVVEALADGQSVETLRGRAVVIAVGNQCKPKIPKLSAAIPDRVFQLHTADYRNPGALPAGAVVIVGSGQSGVQIAEELLKAGRKVYLSTSKVGRAPRRYRGRDMVLWLAETRFWETQLESLPDKEITRAAQPQISGVGRYGHTLSLQYLHRLGAVILGRLKDVQYGCLLLGDDAADNVRFADGFSERLKDGVDRYLEEKGIVPPPLEEDPADLPDPLAACASPLRSLDLAQEQVSTLIWATGFTGDFHWVHLPVLDEGGQPIHQRGVSPVQGVFFLGFTWLHSRKSGIIYGIAEDAEFIAKEIGKVLILEEP
jgi:putative flavoprotein involved in K+ transport